MELFIIPYTLFCFIAFHGIKGITRGDTVVASYSLAWMINLTYLAIAGWGMMSMLLGVLSGRIFLYYAQHVVSLLVGYYTFDTTRLIYTNEKHGSIYIVHHVFSLVLLTLHAMEVLPIDVGCAFLTLFELSNVVLIPYQLCLYKDWCETRYKLTHAMVFTYVPLRLIAIPMYSLFYIPRIQYFTPVFWWFVVCLISGLNMYSIFYSLVISYKYCRWLIKQKN